MSGMADDCMKCLKSGLKCGIIRRDGQALSRLCRGFLRAEERFHNDGQEGCQKKAITYLGENMVKER